MRAYRLIPVLVLLGLASWAHADALRFDIPAQPLPEALRVFADQAKMQLLYKPDVVGEGMSNAVTGELDKRTALERLLEGTGFEVVFSRGNAATIRAVGTRERTALEAGDGKETKSIRLGQVQDSSRDEETEKTTLKEIVVTATKRKELVQDVPMSITAISSGEIERRGLLNSEDYLRSIPGVNQIGGPGTLGGQTIIIRGIETTPTFATFYAGATTATYFGETPTTATAGISGSSTIDIKLVDIERVEVLRGPQGTAFGSSSLGGAVRTIPVAPRLDRFEGKVSANYSATAGYGSGNYNLQAVGNLPLIKDKLAIRAVAYQYQDSGYYRNVAGSDAAFQAEVVVPNNVQAFAKDVNDVGSYYVRGGRLAALYQANDDLRFTLSYLRQKSETDGWAIANTGQPYQQAFLQVAPEHVHRGQTGGLFDYDIGIANAVMEYDFHWADLLATYSDVRGRSRYVADLFGNTAPVSGDRPMDNRVHTGEIRLASKLEGAWSFIGGLYAENVDDDYHSPYVWFGDPNPFGQRLIFEYRNQRELNQKAAFGEVSWKFLPQFTLTGGIRRYRYDRTIQIDQGGPLVGNVSTSRHFDTDASGNNFRANLSYKPTDDALLYAGWSQGFRLGRPQPPLPAGACDQDGNGIIDGTNLSMAAVGTGEIKSDSLNNYELGSKLAFLDRRLTLDVAVFRMNWSDIPVSEQPPCGFSVIANAGKARSDGVEVQLNFQLTKAVRVDLGGSYIDARITQDVPALDAPAGTRLPGSPKVNGNMGVEYAFTLVGHEAYVRADSTYVGTFPNDLSTQAANGSGGYIKVDASAHVAWGSAGVELFVRNLTNNDDITYADFLPSTGYYQRPRTIGVQLDYKF